MKRTLQFIVLAFMIAAHLSCSLSASENKDAPNKRKSENVYVCIGKSATRYHNTYYCRGLSNCRADIEEVSVAEAKRKGRTPCKICY